MIQYNVTLKNLYRILTVNDYPIFSNGVISKRNRRGTTLISFWRSVLVPEWQYGTYGKEIWQKDKSRYLSDFCNLREVVPFYDEYREEILRTLTGDLLLEEIGILSDYFQSHEYDPDVFYRKMHFMLNVLQNDSRFANRHCLYFLKNYNEDTRRDLSELFCDAWVFAMLTICSMCGNAAGIFRFMELAENENFDPRDLYEHRVEKEKLCLPLRRQSESVYGTALESVLFFGREKELYDLTEAVNRSEKIFITGIGGIGKTELLRQLLAHIRKTGTHKNIVSLQYQSALRTSLCSTFDNLQAEDLEGGFNECMYLLRSVDPGSLIILIDNAEILPSETEYWKELVSLKCAIIVTSRGKAPEGFSEIRLENLNERAALLLLRSHYRKKLEKKDEDLFHEHIGKYDFLRHPLTIRTVALSAGRNGWSIPRILTHAENARQEEHLGKDYPQLKRLYRDLYLTEQLSEKERWCVSFLSALPYRQYKAETLLLYVNEPMELTELLQILEELDRKGWLEKKNEACSMHPLIAECIRESGLPEHTFDRFFSCLKEKHLFERYSSFLPLWEEEELMDICEYMLHILRCRKERLEDRDLQAVLELVLEGSPIVVLNDSEKEAIRRQIQSGERPPTVKLFEELLRMRNAEDYDAEKILSLLEEFARDGTMKEMEILSWARQFVLDAIFVSAPEETVKRCLDLMEKIADDPFASFLSAFYHHIYYATALNIPASGEAFALLEERFFRCRRKKEETVVQSAMQYAYIRQGSIATLSGDTAVVRRCRASAAKLTKATRSANIILAEKIFEALFARMENDLASALVKGREYVELTKRFNGENNLNHLAARAELAIILEKTGAKEEAIEIYQDVIKKTKKLYPHAERLFLWMNNLSVAYLGINAPQKAIATLEEARTYLGPENELGDAESSCNLAKAYRQLNDPEQEMYWLEKAAPVFLKIYGPDHPKTVYTRQRAEELKQKEGTQYGG